MKKIGLIGIGIMGESMARNLLKAGFEVAVYSRTKSKAENFLRETGTRWCSSPADCARGRDAVITMVGYPKDVEEVYFGENGVLAAAEQGTYLIDMTTTDPRLSVRIAEEGESRGLHVLDAPVTGGDTGARAGTLAIMVGGNKEDYDACLPILQAMGSTIVYEGGAGTGQHTKMANQIAVAGALSGVCEALAYGERMGLNTKTMFASIEKGAAGSSQMTNLMPKMIAGDDAPGFFLKHLIKDLKIALSQEGGDLPATQEVCSLCEELEAKGYGDKGTQALIHHYRTAAE